MMYPNGDPSTEDDGPKHARTETFDAVTDRADDTAEHKLAWGSVTAYHGRRRARQSLRALRPAGRAQLVALVLAVIAALGLSLVLVRDRPPPGPASGAEPPLVPGLPVIPTVDESPTGAPLSGSPAGSGSRAPHRTPASASPGASPTAAPPSAAPSPSPSPSPLAPTTYEAESGANLLTSGARVAGMSGASGGRAVYALGAPNLGVLRFRAVEVPATGTYTLTIHYQNPWSIDRTAQISVNGGAPVTLRFSPTGTCCLQTRTMSVTFNAGAANTVELANPDDRAPDIDRIVVSG